VAIGGRVVRIVNARSIASASKDSPMLATRNRILSILFLLIALVPVARAEQPAPPTLTYGDLIRRMTDVSRLAVLPEVGEKCAQRSSYDRASRYDAKTGKYVNWDANGDGSGIIRREGDRVVMAEMKGPGCIWRIWSAAAEKGHVKIYLDDQEEPAVDLPFAAYFDGKHAPFKFPALSYNLSTVGSSGQNLYLPIPYQKSCKVVADKGWGNYFHFNYATYPHGTVLPTFSSELVARNAGELKAVDQFFAKQLGSDPAGKRAGEETVSQSVHVEPGQAERIADIKGPAAITCLRVKASFSDRSDEMAALRKLAIRITWDDQKKPAVCCPLGDFFGTAPGVNDYKSLLTGMTESGFYSYWYMPFEKHALVELVNGDTSRRFVDFEITHAPLGRSFAGLGYFHAKWHRDTVELPPDRWPDWQLLQTEGRGRFCGVMLHVWNPLGGWWGEGDEKFFVDGEKFPSTFGTGSEDYFGYAWGNPHLFAKPYHAQTFTQDNRGHQSLLRLHIVDNVPFQKSFEGCIEKYFKNDRGTLYASTVWWYLAPDGNDPYGIVPAAERDGYYVKPQLTIAGFKVLNEPHGDPQLQAMLPFGKGLWKHDEQLWWTGARPRDQLVLALPVRHRGKHELTVHLTKAPDYAIVQFFVNDEKAGEPIDLYNATVVPNGPISLGTFDLKGSHDRLAVKIVGANPKAAKAYMFGIDRIELAPAH
jgi:hypothetical protein